MLKVQNIIKNYGKLQVLKGIDLHIQKGEIVSVVGASGAGKSTLLHIAGTLDRPDSGKVFIAGQEVTSLNEKQLAAFRNEKIGFIFQFHNLMAEFTALENVCIPAFIGNKPEKEVKERAKELLEMLNLQHRMNNLPSQMSGGEQQRTAVARALINSPSIIFADEPSGNLDSKNAQELHRLFFTLREKFDQTFVIVTHNEELAAMADRKLVMQDGFLVKTDGIHQN
ncbi:lipoprotein-releasing system ATP-binding protein [Pseudarcicella hirudinis]|uniref:Lipoprotein-releasing system ATP-binding protein n=1 Tax=Pseudarcicella hirudinis TaxID=1079859 RepID=A0A1I5W6L9_9BACT|nr:ABC transporter ATP-binding protein [Pseudarcicella hirudinis]SFQ15267.1 lipoprotein-releasing system ATP-binding protein [Pseudarcicella hirudinis]